MTTAAVVIPKAMAFAVIAGLPVQAGLYAAFAPMLVYGILGQARELSVSTTTALAILTAAQLHLVVPDADPERLMGAVATLTLLTGGLLLLAGILRLGFLANFISDPVLIGFKAGIGLVVVIDQLPKLLGLHIDRTGILRDIAAVIQHVPQTHVPTLLLAGALLAILLGMERFVPRAPAPLVAVVLAIAGAGLLGLGQAGVALTGAIPAGIPVPHIPDWSLASKLWPGAMGLALMSFTESIAAARAFARPNDPQPRPNRELVALGGANLAGSLFQCLPAGGGTSQTAVNAQAGARTQVAGLVTAGIVIATLLFLAPLLSLLPRAALAAIVLVMALPLLGLTDFRAVLRVRRTEFLWAVLTCAGVVFLGTLEGILIAVGVSVLTLFHQGTHPPVYVVGRKPGHAVYRPLTGEHPEDEIVPGLLILRTEGRMNFASAPRVADRMQALLRQYAPRVVILECSAIPDFEYTALRALIAAEKRLRAEGITLWLAALNPEARQVVQRSALGASLGPNRVFDNVIEAVKAYESSNQEANSVNAGRIAV